MNSRFRKGLEKKDSITLNNPLRLSNSTFDNQLNHVSLTKLDAQLSQTLAKNYMSSKRLL